jgi:hypothetical protein
MNALSIGVVTMVTDAVCGVQEAHDRVALAVPAFGDWVHGIPSNINVRGLLLEDLAAAAAAHNAGGKLQPPAAAGAAAAAAAAVAGSSAAPALVDSLGLVTAASSSSSSSSGTKQQQVMPPLTASCLEGLQLLLSAGWMVAADVLVNKGSMVELMLQQPGGGLSNASVQVGGGGNI